MHILDIVQNSIAAKATVISINIEEDPNRDLLTIIIKDNGKGIAKEKLAQVTDPFFTTRKTRNVGLGLPLFADAARQVNGDFEINSVLGEGTEVRASFPYSHIDRTPLGDIGDTLLTIIVLNPEIDLLYSHSYVTQKFKIDTSEIKRELNMDELNHKAVIAWLRDFIKEGLDDLYGGGL